MGKLRITVILTIAVVVLLTACSTAAPAAQPTASPVTIQFATKPEIAQAGDVELNFRVLDSTGQPLSGADVDVIADHTEMGGMIMHGKATEQETGLYSIKANFSMAGKWKVTVQVQKDNSLDYKQDIDLQVK